VKGLIDPTKPSEAEVIEHNTKVAKANFAMDVVKQLATNSRVLEYFGTDNAGKLMAEVAIEAAEKIMANYPLGRKVVDSSIDA
jgi:hypothetical protein